MRDDQKIRAAGMGTVGVSYGFRLYLIGNGVITVFGFKADAFGLAMLCIVVLAMPETLNYLPIGPTHPVAKPEQPEQPSGPDRKRD